MRNLFTTCAAAALFCLGCAARPPTTAPAAPTSATPPLAPKPLAVRYAGYLDPSPLTPEQLAEIQAEAARTRPEGRNVWFVLVLYNRQREGKWYYNAEVYFAPDESSPRTRRGRYTGVSTFSQEVRHLLPPDTPLPGYVQVSLPEAPFADALAVPWSPTLPFDPPDDIAVDDLVKILDAARPMIGHGFVNDVASGEFHTGDSADRDLPVCRIEVEPGGTICVDFGWQVGPLAGHGLSVRVEKTPTGFRAIPGVGRWVS